MALLEVTINLKLPPEFYAALTQLTMQGVKIMATLEELKALSEEAQLKLTNLQTEVGKVGGAVDTLEQQVRDALAGVLPPEKQQLLDDAFANFRSVTDGIEQSAGVVKKATDDAADGLNDPPTQP